jgi:hypothetical protein
MQAKEKATGNKELLRERRSTDFKQAPPTFQKYKTSTEKGCALPPITWWPAATLAQLLQADF